MTKYRFSIDGIPVTIYPQTALFYDRAKILGELSNDEFALALLFDDRADFRVDIFDKNNNEPREPHLFLAALFCFFKNVRSYPDMTFDIAYGDGIVTIDISDSEYKFTVKVGKWKRLSVNTAHFPDGIDIEYNTVCGDITCAVAICFDSNLFDKDVLRRILDLGREYGIRAALSVSFEDVLHVHQVGEALPYEAICAAVTVISSKGVILPNGRHNAFICNSEYEISIMSKRIDFYPSVKYLS